MRFFRPALTTVLLGTLMTVCLAVIVGPAHARTTWEATTKGSPVATEVGVWVESPDQRNANLNFLGGHVLGAGTRFTASWKSPFTVDDGDASWWVEYNFTNVNELGADVILTESFRYRTKGGSWSRWNDQRFVLKPGINRSGGGAGVYSIGGPPMQFQWKLTGKIVAPTILTGSATITSG